MKLTYYPYELNLRDVFTISSHSRTSTPGVQVEIEWEGKVGYGEASMPPYLGETIASVTEFLGKIKLNQFKDPFDPEEILAYVDNLRPGNTAAKAAIDMALHDLNGKLLGVPLYKLLGINNPENTPFTTYTIGIDTPEAIKKKTLEAIKRFKILKVKLGGENDREIIQAIRSVTTLPLAVDANQGWKDKYKALDRIQWLQEEGVVMIEQPMPVAQLEDTAWVTAHSSLPIYADESVQRLKDILPLKGAFTGINIKLMKCTGLNEAMKMIRLAREVDMKVMIGCMTETSCAISAAAHLSPLADFADLDGNLLISNDPFKGMEIVDGRITLTNLDGIGIKKISEQS